MKRKYICHFGENKEGKEFSNFRGEKICNCAKCLLVSLVIKYFFKKVYGVCRNTLIIKSAIMYFVTCFPKYGISNINGFLSQA